VSGGRELTLAWTPTQQEYVRALKLWRDASGQRQRSRNRGLTVVAAGLVLFVFVAASGGTRAVAVAAPLVLVVVGFVWFRDLVPYWGLRRAIRKAPALLAPVTVTVDKDGITSVTGSVTQRFDWNRFAAFVEIPDLLLLGLSLDSPAVSGILPRSAASSTGVWDAVTSRARRSVPLHPRLAQLEATKTQSA